MHENTIIGTRIVIGTYYVNSLNKIKAKEKIENIIKKKELRISQKCIHHYNNMKPFWLCKLIKSVCRKTMVI